jgi:hypothetical protein
VFAGVANEDAATGSGLALATIGGVLFTGILMGLGSSPTHEVIRVLQESKKARKAASSPEVEEDVKDLGDGGAGGAGAAGFGAGAASGQARAPRTLIRVR